MPIPFHPGALRYYRYHQISEVKLRGLSIEEGSFLLVEPWILRVTHLMLGFLMVFLAYPTKSMCSRASSRPPLCGFFLWKR